MKREPPKSISFSLTPTAKQIITLLRDGKKSLILATGESSTQKLAYTVPTLSHPPLPKNETSHMLKNFKGYNLQANTQ